MTFRLTTRRMMILVAVLALASLAGRVLRDRWLRRPDRIPVSQSHISARVGPRFPPPYHDFVPGRPVPVAVTYDLRFSGPKPPPGTDALILGQVWFEDLVAKQPVDGYSFDARLTVGGRESTSGTFDWDAMIPHEGRYMLHSMLYTRMPSGEWKRFAGTSWTINFRTPPPTDAPGGGP